MLEDDELETMILSKMQNQKNENMNFADTFGSKDDYIQTLEMSVDILQNELRETVDRLSELSESTEVTKEQEVHSKAKNSEIETSDFFNKIPDFSELDSIDLIFDSFYNFLSNHWQIVELDLFVVDDSKNVKKLQNINSSVNLENVFNDLEERGLLDWAANSNEIKAIQSFDNVANIKSLLIIPVKMMKKNVAFFIANTTLLPNEINLLYGKNILSVAQNVYYLISIIQTETDKENSLLEYGMLRHQTLLASNQIALSEIVIALNDELEMPLKVIKTNIDLIQKGVGDVKRRTDIITEQFAKLANSHKLMQYFGNHIEHIPTKYNFIGIVNQTLEVLESHLSKNGITVSKNFDDKSLKNETVSGFKGQLIFSILNIILNSISTMPEGGKINLGIFKNDDNSTISFILTDDGTGTDNPEISGDLIALMDLSDRKVKARFLFLISQHIICQHNGKFSVYSELGKGTTYKIILPIS